MKKTYYNLICEEISLFGGKIIHLDKNVGDLEEVDQILKENLPKYPNAKWELYPMSVK